MSVNELPGMNAAKYGPGDRLIAMHAAHNAFRRDLERLAGVATAANLRDPNRRASIMSGWTIFKHQLHIHHSHEDRFLWPRLRDRLAGSESATSVLEDMQAEHDLIDPLLEAVDSSFLDAHHVDVAEVIDELITKLAFHLGHEERDAIPLIGEAISNEEWSRVVKDIRKATKLSSAAEFMPWLTDGVDREQSKTIASIMPPPARVVLNRVWKPKYDRVSHW